MECFFVIEFVGVLLLNHFLWSYFVNLPLLLCNNQLMSRAMYFWHRFLDTIHAKPPPEPCPLAMINQLRRFCSFQCGNSLCFDASIQIALFYFLLPPHLFPAESPNPKTTTKKEKKTPITHPPCPILKLKKHKFPLSPWRSLKGIHPT